MVELASPAHSHYNGFLVADEERRVFDYYRLPGQGLRQITYTRCVEEPEEEEANWLSGMEIDQLSPFG